MRSLVRLGFGSGQTQEAPRLFSDILEIYQTATFADNIEQIAVLTGCRVGPFTGRAAARAFRFQADEHRSAGRVPDVADQPVIADATPVGEIVTTHRLGLARETMCQLR